jgi:hypothetical protein
VTVEIGLIAGVGTGRPSRWLTRTATPATETSKLPAAASLARPPPKEKGRPKPPPTPRYNPNKWSAAATLLAVMTLTHNPLLQTMQATCPRTSP